MNYIIVTTGVYINACYSYPIKPDAANWWSEQDQQHLINHLYELPNGITVPPLYKLEHLLDEEIHQQVFGVLWDEPTWFEIKDASGKTIDDFKVSTETRKLQKIVHTDFTSSENSLVILEESKGTLQTEIPLIGNYDRNKLQFHTVQLSDAWIVCNGIEYDDWENFRKWEVNSSRKVRTQAFVSFSPQFL